jgi:toxin-antitoxin system PIN domain toxin
VYLLDANVLIALLTPEHVSHQRTRVWFGSGVPFATCPITQGALLRFLMRWSARPVITEAKSILKAVCAFPNHHFWADDLDYAHLPEKGVRGHRQITDAYLATLANAHNGLLATMDEGLAALHASAVLI